MSMTYDAPMRGMRLWLMVGWIALAGCAVERTQTRAPLTGEARRFAEITSYLASDALGGRGPGTRGITRARDYLVDRLRSAGLKPAFGEAYTQELSIALGVDVLERRLSFGGARGAAHRIMDLRPLAVGTGGAFTGDAVFAGYGIDAPQQHYDSYADVEPNGLRGKVVFIYRYEPLDDDGDSRWHAGDGWTRHAFLSNKASLAAEHGAAAVVIVNPPARAAAPMPRPDAAMHFDPVDAPVMMIELEQFKRVLRAAGRADDAAAELQRRADRGGSVVKLDVRAAGRVDFEFERAPTHNIAGVLTGRGPLADEVVVIGAHYDHLGTGGWGSRVSERTVHPGADDNASGTAAAVMLAERYAEDLAQGGRAVPRRTLMFALFTGEERGLVGSQYFTRHLGEAGLEANDIAAMINFDMIGRLRHDELRVFGVKTGESWREIIDRAATGTNLKVKATGSGFGASDHASFYEVGVPVVHLFTGLHHDYHRPGDTADKLDPHGAVRVIDFAERMIDQLIGAGVTLTHRPPAEDRAEPTHGQAIETDREDAPEPAAP